MATPAPTVPMSVEQSTALADFARTCRAAARSVSLYPATHPAIQGALARVVAAAGRITSAGDVTITVLPALLLVDGHGPVKADVAIEEFAELLHDRLIGELRVGRGAEAEDWRMFLLLLSRTVEELLGDGGIAKAWATTGRSHFSFREIDYAEVLRERAGADDAARDRVVEFCLQGLGDAPIDDEALDALVATLERAEGVGELVDALKTASIGSASMGARVAALLELVARAVDTPTDQRDIDRTALLQALADAAARMPPDMVLAFLQQARPSAGGGDSPLAADVVDRIGDTAIASFVAGSVVAERGASERLALAFEALVPDAPRKDRLLDLARAAAAESPLGAEPAFDGLWRGAADLLRSYSDKPFVSEDYGRELSSTRSQAIEVERVSNDPPERVQAWLATVSDPEVRRLDLALILDLLRIEDDPGAWHDVAVVAGADIERRLLQADISTAESILARLVAERGEGGRATLRPVADASLQVLASGSLGRHVVALLRTASDDAVDAVGRMCHAIGPGVVRPLAFALAVEENPRAIRHARELLLGFGAAGRASVEQLRQSSNPAARRAAIDLLRAFGGDDALPELTSMLDDADPQVQREAIRAIVQMGSDAAFGVLEGALVGGSASRDTILQQLVGLRDDRAITLLCYVLHRTSPRGKLVVMHEQIIESLGTLTAHPDSIQALRTILHRGEWWAPRRTARLRQAAATALARLASPDADTVLTDAAEHGSRSVRAVARRAVSSGAGGTP